MRLINPARFGLALALANALIAVNPGEACADPQPSLDLRGIRPSADGSGTIFSEPARVPESGVWNTALWMRYAYRPFTLRDSDTEELRFTIVRHHISGDFSASVGLFGRASLSIDLPFLLLQTGDRPTHPSRRNLGESTVSAQALGDLSIQGKLLLFANNRLANKGFLLSLSQRLSLPTGDENSYMAEGHIASETRFLLDFKLNAFTVHGGLGVKFRGESERFACGTIPEPPVDQEDLCQTRIGHELPFGLGISVRPELLGWDDEGLWTFYAEAGGYVPLWPRTPFSEGSARISALRAGAGARLALGDFALTLGLYGAPHVSVGAPIAEAITSLAWQPHVYDADGDGISDKIDRCPAFAEDFDRFEDSDGCPEADNDQDRVPDGEDRCVTEREDIDQFEDHDGCIDADNDGDGFADTIDACPNEKGLKHEDPKKRGCPIKDEDQDGIEGEADKCPDAAEDIDQFEDSDGCPDYDNDEDGIPDRLDACKDKAGIDSPNEKERGCPDPDKDKDTYAAAEDQCPDEAETFNGIDDGDGCPESDEKKQGKPLLILQKGKDGPTLQLNSDIKIDAAKADTEPLPLIVLRAIAHELLTHPQWKLHIGIRPGLPKEEPAKAKNRAETIVKQLAALARRADPAGFVQAVDFEQVKNAPDAKRLGIGLKIIGGAPANTTKIPANPTKSAPVKTH